MHKVLIKQTENFDGLYELVIAPVIKEQQEAATKLP